MKRIFLRLLQCYLAASFVHFLALLSTSQGIGGHLPWSFGLAMGIFLLLTGPYIEIQDIWQALTLAKYSMPKELVCRPCIIEESSLLLLFFFAPFFAFAYFAFRKKVRIEKRVIE